MGARAAVRQPPDPRAIVLGGVTALAAAAATVALGPAALALPVGGVVAVLLARYRMVLYVAFLHIGLFKGEPPFSQLPFDATIALGILLAGVCVHRLATGHRLTPSAWLVIPVGVIAVMMAVSLNWTPVVDYGTTKLVKFMTFTLLATLAPFFLIESREDLKRFLTVFALGGVFAAGVVLVFGTTQGDARLEFSGEGNTIFTSRFILTGALILILTAALHLVQRHRLLLAGAGGVLVVIAASIGSRGPVIALAAALLCTVAAVVLRQPRRLIPVLVVAAAGIAIFPFVSLPETSAQRLSGVAEDPIGTLQEDGRSALYRQAIDLIEEYPLRGIGTGGFFLYSYVIANREERYPHNVFLESAAELGIGTALLLGLSIVLLLMALYGRAWRAADEEERGLVYVVAAVFLLSLFATQFSGDFNDNRSFWAMLGVGWLVARHALPAGGAQERAPEAR